MTTFRAKRREYPLPEQYVRVQVFAGKDADHLQLTGEVKLHEEEVDEFCLLVNGGYLTKTGKVLTAEEMQRLADEAEAGWLADEAAAEGIDLVAWPGWRVHDFRPPADEQAERAEYEQTPPPLVPAPKPVSPEVVHDLLLLADQPTSLGTIRSWSQAERLSVAEWAAAVHLVASDNDDVKIPPMPEALGEHG